MKNYEKPIIEEESLSIEDIIAASSFGDDQAGDEKINLFEI